VTYVGNRGNYKVISVDVGVVLRGVPFVFRNFSLLQDRLKEWKANVRFMRIRNALLLAALNHELMFRASPRSRPPKGVKLSYHFLP